VTPVAAPTTFTSCTLEYTRVSLPWNAADTRRRTAVALVSNTVVRIVKILSPAVASPPVPLSTSVPTVARTRPAASRRCRFTLAAINDASVIAAVTVTGVPVPTGTVAGTAAVVPITCAASTDRGMTAPATDIDPTSHTESHRWFIPTSSRD
jgi:hypothetical protein